MSFEASRHGEASLSLMSLVRIVGIRAQVLRAFLSAFHRVLLMLLMLLATCRIAEVLWGSHWSRELWHLVFSWWGEIGRGAWERKVIWSSQGCGLEASGSIRVGKSRRARCLCGKLGWECVGSVTTSLGA
jgi:hypothetical protein